MGSLPLEPFDVALKQVKTEAEGKFPLKPANGSVQDWDTYLDLVSGIVKHAVHEILESSTRYMKLMRAVRLNTLFTLEYEDETGKSNTRRIIGMMVQDRENFILHIALIWLLKVLIAESPHVYNLEILRIVQDTDSIYHTLLQIAKDDSQTVETLKGAIERIGGL